MLSLVPMAMIFHYIQVYSILETNEKLIWFPFVRSNENNFIFFSYFLNILLFFFQLYSVLFNCLKLSNDYHAIAVCLTIPMKYPYCHLSFKIDRMIVYKMNFFSSIKLFYVTVAGITINQ